MIFSVIKICDKVFPAELTPDNLHTLATMHMDEFEYLFRIEADSLHDAEKRLEKITSAILGSRESVMQAKRDMYEEILRQHNGNVAEVCRQLKINRRTGYRNIELLGIELSDFRK